jgi:hypothetical protein
VTAEGGATDATRESDAREEAASELGVERMREIFYSPPAIWCQDHGQ